MSTTPAILTEVDAGVGIITLNRPERHNVVDEAMIAELSDAMDRMAGDDAVRLVVLSGIGKMFCAGLDPLWLQRSDGNSAEAHRRDAGALAALLLRFADCPKPVVARVQGPAYGAGVGLVAACDMAIATFDSQFALSEARAGLIPAVTAPHVIAAIGERHARRYMLTAEVFSAAEAYRIGLVHEMVPDEASLDEAIGEWVGLLLDNGPQAMAACKALIQSVSNRPLGPKVVDYTVECHAGVRDSAEAREGLAALLQNRRPGWQD